MPESGSLYFQFKPNIYDMLNYLVVESNLESGGASVDKLCDKPLGLDGGDDRVHVLRNDITMVELAAGSYQSD